MRKFNHIQQRIANFTEKQIKFMGHTVNNYNYEKDMFTGIKRYARLD